MGTPASYFFMSYSRENVQLQRRVISGLRERGVNAWVDVENLIPGSPAWEREIERAIRGAAGLIVLLSPEANNSEWVRREISFADGNDKRIFPVLIQGDEDDSIPLRLSDHQRVDLRRNFNEGLDQLANALKEYLGVTAVHRLPKQKASISFSPATLRKLALAGVIAMFGLFCLGGMALAASYVYNNISQPTKVISTTPVDADPIDLSVTVTPADIVIHKPEPSGRIVFTCQVQGDEICIINADGSGWKRLTDLPAGSSYSNLSPDGKFVLFVSKDSGTGSSEIFELNLETGKIKQLTSLDASVGAPEISPDNQFILFTYRSGNKNSQIWIMDRDGHDPHELYSSNGRDAHDATWSPDGSQILFAFGRGENNKLYIMDFNGREPRLVNDSIDTRGRSDWSPAGLIVLDMGGPFMHEVYLMDLDGSNLHQVSEGYNSQGASFSPDGEWIALTAYTDVENKNESSCEIYIMRVDGSDFRRLTTNNYCDYQPRWGN